MSVRRVHVFVLLVFGISVAGCGVWGDLFGSRHSADTAGDGGVCTKNPQEIRNVMLAPPTCTGATSCPCGTFCSSETGGNCMADCVDDTWCATGLSCSAFGQCLASGGGGDGGVTTANPTCPRNETLLDTLRTTAKRTCQFSDICPFGSSCDTAKGLCDYQCRSDANCTSMAQTGQTLVCNCEGKCVEPTKPRVMPTKALPTLNVTPSSFGVVRPADITSPDWGNQQQRTIEVSLTSTFLIKDNTGFVVGPGAYVTVTPGPNLNLQCPAGSQMGGGADAGAGTGSCTILINAATYARVGTTDNYRTAPVFVVVSPAATTTSVESWEVRFGTTGASDAPQTTRIRYLDPSQSSPPAPNLQPLNPVPNDYLGIGTVNLTSPTGASFDVPVTAKGDGAGHLMLRDESRILSPSGLLILTDTDYQFWLDPERGDPLLGDNFQGGIWQAVTNVSLSADTTSGSVSGTFYLHLRLDDVQFGQSLGFGQYVPASVSLRKADQFELRTCDVASETSCPNGLRCDHGFCSSGPALEFVSLSTGRTETHVLLHKKWDSWGSAAGAGDLLHIYMPPTTWAPTTSEALTVKLETPPLSYSGDMLATFRLPNGQVASFDDGKGNLVTKFKPRAIPLFAARDANGTAIPVREMLSRCMSELRRDPPENYSSFEFGPYLDYQADCVDLGRLFTTAGPVLGGDRRLVQHLLRQWLELHSFVGREALEEVALNNVLSQAGVLLADTGNNGGTSPTPPPLPQILSTMESGLGLLLFNTDRSLLPSLTADELNAPDYRTHDFFDARRCGSASECNSPDGQTMDCRIPDGQTNSYCEIRSLEAMPQHNQPVGLPATLLETAGTYLKVLDAYVADIERRTYGQPTDQGVGPSQAEALNRFGLAMRLAMSVESVATTLRNKAVDAFCTGPNCGAMTKRWEAARDEFNVIRSLVIQKVAALRTNANPLGIPEDDVPLFFGDPAGTSSQYFASSDYMLNGWADPAVKSAQAALTTARESWVSHRQSLLQDELNQHNRQSEIDALKSKYGQPILNNCGRIFVTDGEPVGHDLQSSEVVEYLQSHPYSAEICYVRPECVGGDGLDGRTALEFAFEEQFLDSRGVLLAETGSPDSVVDRAVRQEICRFDWMGGRGEDAKGMPLRMVQFCKTENSEYGYGIYHSPTTMFGTCRVFRADGPDGHLYFTNAPATASPTPQNTIPLAALVRKISRSELGPAAFYSKADVPSMYSSDPRSDYRSRAVKGSSEDDVYGFKDLHSGNRYFESSTEICSAGPDVGHEAPYGPPEDQWGGRYTKNYPITSDVLLPPRCYKGQMGVAWFEIESARLRLRRAKHVLDSGKENVGDIFTECKAIDKDNTALNDLQNKVNDLKFAYGTMATFLGLQGSLITSIVTHNPGVIFSSAASLFAQQIADEQAKVNQLESSFGRDEKAIGCWNSWSAQRRALADSMIDAQLAMNEVNKQVLVLNNMETENAQNVSEGHAVIQREQNSPLSSVGHHYWLDEKVERFKKELEWSRRLTFLAMRSVEWELQQSLPYRSLIVSAAHPDQLEDVVRGLKQEQGSRTINRRRPAESSLVLSLRDDILSITDRSSEPPGERNWTPAKRFAGRLWDDRYAYRDKDGNYLGQAVPFNMGVLGILQTRCGERLWRATATIQGDGLTSDTPGAPILLLKKNTFGSQFCSGKGGDQQMQQGAIHPSAQLFKPGSSIDMADSSDYTAALLYPWFNIRRSEFYKDAYRDGASEELAGRGLYGDYVLLFPKQLLDDGFALERVEDVLLRFDYLSVDNLSQ
jgi:hypothetical protein